MNEILSSILSIFLIFVQIDNLYAKKHSSHLVKFVMYPGFHGLCTSMYVYQTSYRYTGNQGTHDKLHHILQFLFKTKDQDSKDALFNGVNLIM